MDETTPLHIVANLILDEYCVLKRNTNGIYQKVADGISSRATAQKIAETLNV